MKRMTEVDGKTVKVVEYQLGHHKLFHIAWHPLFAQLRLHRNLPATHSTEKQFITPFTNNRTYTSGQAPVIVNPSEEGVGIEQGAHSLSCPCKSGKEIFGKWHIEIRRDPDLALSAARYTL